jgi:hypothetical protein
VTLNAFPEGNCIGNRQFPSMPVKVIIRNDDPDTFGVSGKREFLIPGFIFVARTAKELFEIGLQLLMLCEVGRLPAVNLQEAFHVRLTK